MTFIVSGSGYLKSNLILQLDFKMGMRGATCRPRRGHGSPSPQMSLILGINLKLNFSKMLCQILPQQLNSLNEILKIRNC